MEGERRSEKCSFFVVKPFPQAVVSCERDGSIKTCSGI